tara:strand:- start:585 stop:1694 length:1110 start_codon:yes stop_codon:yes gene_type:complete
LNYKETLFFIAKSLTISFEEKNRDEIEFMLKTTDIDWEAVVKVSTSHYVFPAVYCNFKRADFLKYLPSDLVSYMKYITNLNRDRNTQILLQAHELNKLLLASNITPIFLKGTGNLLEGLYEDIGERMIGDIDFIVPKGEYKKAIEKLSDDGYNTISKSKYFFPEFIHHPRLIKEGNIAAVEVHKEFLIDKYSKEFNYDLICKKIKEINGVTILSFEDQLALSIIATQINDYGYEYKNIVLRNAYDVFLLSKKTNTNSTIMKFKKLRHPLNCFLASCFFSFGEINSLKYIKTKESEIYLKTFKKLLNNDRYRRFRFHLIHKYIFIKTRMNILYKSIFNKQYRVWLLNRISDKNWQRKKLVQLGLKKNLKN